MSSSLKALSSLDPASGNSVSIFSFTGRPRRLAKHGLLCSAHRAAGALLLLMLPGMLAAAAPRDLDVIVVTDTTGLGQKLPAASPDQPVYYAIVDHGNKTFGKSWAGETIPPSRAVLKLLLSALAEQGYRVADEQHPPTQILVFAWGMLTGNEDREALGFLGGEKVNLMWEQKKPELLGPEVLKRGMRRGLPLKVWEMAENDLFLGVVLSYTMESPRGDSSYLLWKTRFACPAKGLKMAEALPYLIKSAAPYFGRETSLPVNVNTAELFKGRVDLGELNIIETNPALDKEESNKSKAPR